MRGLWLSVAALAWFGACGGNDSSLEDDVGYRAGAGGQSPAAGGAGQGGSGGHAGAKPEGGATAGAGAPEAGAGGAISTPAADGGAPAGGVPAANTGGAPEAGSTSTEGGAAGAGGVSSPPTKPAPGGVAFAEDNILEFRLTIAASDWTELEEHGDLEEYKPAAASVSGTQIDGATFAQVGLRHKGAWSLHHCWDDFGGVRSHAAECAKLSYKIKFDEYDSNARLDGLKRINLHASSGDATKLRELLAYDTFRAFGVDAPRARPAKVYINGIYQGLFIAVEDIDGRYAKAHFPDGADGNLYKEVWPRTEATDADFLAALQTNESVGDVSDMRDFATAIAAATPATFQQTMASWVDIENTLRYVAVDRALKNWDGIMAFYSPISPHNYFWYHDNSATPLFHLVPWDLDNTFWDFDPYMHPQDWVSAAPVPDWNSVPANCTPRSVWEVNGTTTITPPRCDPFLDLLAQTSFPHFTELGAMLLDGPLKFTTMNIKVAHWMAEIEPLLVNDPTVNATDWQSAALGFPATLQRAIVDFQSFLAAGLIEEPKAAPEPTDAELNATTTDTGLHIGGISNFEFATNPISPAGVTAYSDPLSTFRTSWNATNPLYGSADLRFDFTFSRNPGATYNEWVNLWFNTNAYQEFDLRSYTTLVLRLKTDTARNVRVRVASGAYDDAFGGAWQEFGVDVNVGPIANAISIPLSSLSYPSWAKDAWTTGQGWTTPDTTARDTVLSRCNGIVFAPSATFDGTGELASPTETGFLQIDTIYFR